MSQPQTESYTAAKGGIAALTHALAVSLAGKAVIKEGIFYDILIYGLLK